jgi:DNA modification methylase
VTEIVVGDARVVLGDCRDVLRTLADNSVDSVVTDPPYEIGFMGRSWDGTGVAYDVTVWEECLRVLKPGGHILAFGGSRTWHRLAVAVEDAGFEIRDSIAWIYGSGFPKSLDVSKAIDKSDAKVARRARDLRFVKWMRASGLTASKCDQILKSAGVISQTSSRAIHYFNDGQPQVPTEEMFKLLRPHLPAVPDDIERLVFDRTVESKNFAEREVIGQRPQRGSPVGVVAFNTADSETELITAASTAEAQQWSGWGTALKPAFEPVVVGRKPFGKGVTVAENVLAWGVGGLNIDASRVKYKSGEVDFSEQQKQSADNPLQIGGAKPGDVVQIYKPEGRWPANVILDEVTAGLVDKQSGENPSRFFYVAKTSKRDRNEGLETPSTHPTVKPTALMRYLIKLVTPPGGTVLDPFTGSGSTGKAALLDGFKFVGAELTEEYLPIIEGRLRWALGQDADVDETLF